MNYDKLSFAEAKRLKGRLEDLGIHLEKMVVNKVQGTDYTSELKKEFGIQNISVFPMDDRHISGIEQMRQYNSRFDTSF